MASKLVSAQVLSTATSITAVSAAGPGQLVVQVVGELVDGEDEDQAEEQLQRGDVPAQAGERRAAHVGTPFRGPVRPAWAIRPRDKLRNPDPDGGSTRNGSGHGR
ncbi:hypothetical protein AB0L35_37810 [Streptomyces sp. NPDC052309]|uniref:hypothetical protein n=1 Tax=Streptomyces sp. NPDC052309 TaxID=3155421 RepID=UPI003432FC75